MTRRESFLEREPEEIRRLLVEHARRERAPLAARQRALATASAVAASTAVVSGASGAQAVGAAAKSLPWLAAKSAAVGMASAVLVIGASQQIQSPEQRDAASTRAIVLPAPSARTFASPRGQRSHASVAAPSAAPPSTASVRARSVPHAQRAEFSPASGAAPDSLNVAADPQPPAHGEELGREVRDGALLAQEVTALKNARGALARGESAAALGALDAYEREFPSGALRAEAMALRIETLLRRGQRQQATTLAADFARDYPASPLSGRVRALLDRE